MVIFNGLKGADFAAYNYLSNVDLSEAISISKISHITCYHYRTIQKAMRRLSDYGLLKYRRESIGQAYKYELIGEENGK